jgi:hypothetical protein
MGLFGASPNDGTFLLWLKFIASIGLAIAMPIVLVAGIRHCWLQWSSHDWPKTTMTVTKIEKIKDGVEFDYEFIVEGAKYSASDKERDSLSTDASRNALLGKYAVGTTHDVYYRPEAPGDYSVLTPGGNVVMQLIGTFLGGLTLVALCFNLRVLYKAIFLREFERVS